MGWYHRLPTHELPTGRQFIVHQSIRLPTMLMKTYFYMFLCPYVLWFITYISVYLQGKFLTVSFVRLFSTMHFQMSPQIACLGGFIFTLVTFVWLVSTMGFQMCPQIVCPGRSKVTLVTFVWFFSTVWFQMSLQSVCMRGCKATLFALVWSPSFCHSHRRSYIVIIVTQIIVILILIHHY